MKRCSAEEAAALLRPRDTMILGFGPAQPGVLLEEMGKRDDGEDLTVFGGLLLQLYIPIARSYSPIKAPSAYTSRAKSVGETGTARISQSALGDHGRHQLVTGDRLAELPPRRRLAPL